MRGTMLIALGLLSASFNSINAQTAEELEIPARPLPPPPPIAFQHEFKFQSDSKESFGHLPPDHGPSLVYEERVMNMKESGFLVITTQDDRLEFQHVALDMKSRFNTFFENETYTRPVAHAWTKHRAYVLMAPSRKVEDPYPAKSKSFEMVVVDLDNKSLSNYHLAFESSRKVKGMKAVGPHSVILASPAGSPLSPDPTTADIVTVVNGTANVVTVPLEDAGILYNAYQGIATTKDRSRVLIIGRECDMGDCDKAMGFILDEKGIKDKVPMDFAHHGLENKLGTKGEIVEFTGHKITFLGHTGHSVLGMTWVKHGHWEMKHANVVSFMDMPHFADHLKPETRPRFWEKAKVTNGVFTASKGVYRPKLADVFPTNEGFCVILEIILPENPQDPEDLHVSSHAVAVGLSKDMSMAWNTAIPIKTTGYGDRITGAQLNDTVVVVLPYRTTIQAVPIIDGQADFQRRKRAGKTGYPLMERSYWYWEYLHNDLFMIHGHFDGLDDKEKTRPTSFVSILDGKKFSFENPVN